MVIIAYKYSMLRQTKKNFEYDIAFAKEYSQFGKFQEVYDFFVNSFVNIHGDPVGSLVDLCCGTADIPNGFKSKFSKLEVVGYDESSAMIESANNTNISLVNNSINKIDRVFDNIISNNAYHHFDNVEDFWNVVQRISHTNSKILISDVVRPENEIDVAQIVEEVLGVDSVFSTAFTLSLTSAYNKEELQTHIDSIASMKLIIIDTPIKNYKLFFIHN
jgi:ubiquinone/menaquinone biosynthesis C-methylase UbiE